MSCFNVGQFDFLLDFLGKLLSIGELVKVAQDNILIALLDSVLIPQGK